MAEYIRLLDNRLGGKVVSARVVNSTKRLVIVRVNGQEIAFRRRDGSVSWGPAYYDVHPKDLEFMAPQNARFSSDRVW